jgi:hypothetical protein
MKTMLTTILLLVVIYLGAAEFDYNGKFINGMDGWVSAAKGVITEVKNKENNKTEIRLDGRKHKTDILVHSLMYGSGVSGDKVKLQATAYGSGHAFIGVQSLDKNGNQTGITRSYFRLNKQRKNYYFEIILPQSTRKDRKGNIMKTSKTRVVFGIKKGGDAIFTEVSAKGVKAK